MSPRNSPRESLNSSPGQIISPRNSPPTLRPLISPFFKGLDSESDILDFSLHRSAQGYREELFNMANMASKSSPLRGSPPPLGLHRTGDSPLDLSVPRKRAADALLEAAAAHGKMNPIDLAKLSPWGFPLPPQLASTLALRPDLAALKSDLALWNGKFKPETSPTGKLPPFSLGGHSGPTPSEASKALERMSELSKLGGDAGMGGSMGGVGGSSELFRSNNVGNSSGGRTNAWQSHWLSKGQDATKDVLKCVWCKASFNTLADLTTHMKEAKHCGVNLPPPIPPPTSGASLPPHMPSKLNCKPPVSSPGTASSSSSCDLISSIKETMPLPRKLVRGQDVWLGKGAEQTRQILKCMWCGQSFKSLAEMTRHMQQTQHYTNIISQEQIISWKSPEEKTNSQTHVNAVLTCKVCDQAFSSLKELSNHMVKYAHYKEHIMRSITESGSRRRQTREKRKKSLPVRKLLELERAQQELRSTNDYGRMKEGTPSRITCEKCGDKIDTPLFVDHIRTCVGVINRELLKSSILSPEPDQGSRYDSSKDTDSEGKMTPDKKDIDPIRENLRDTQREKRDSLTESEGEKLKSEETKESPSVLCALEKLIEKSFDSGKSKAGGSPLGSSILRRLGIDEGTDYSKPLMDPQLMGMYATFSRLHTGHGSSFNLPPSFGPSERGLSMRGPDTGHSPSGDSDTRDTFPRSPLRPSSRPDSRPASTGSITRDGSASDRSIEMIRNDLHMSGNDDNHPTENGTDHSDNDMDSGASRDGMGVKQEPNDQIEICPDREPSSNIPEEPKIKEELRIKDEFKLKKEERMEDEISSLTYKSDTYKSDTYKSDIERRSPTPVNRLVTSPTGSSRSGTPHSESSTNRGPSSGALGGLSALLGSVGGDAPGSSHPLAALQKLCDKTETQPRPAVTTSSLGAQTNPGAILAFSWACNDAVTADSIMKCAFCDTPFISKGAYRHHLSKMHFVKDGIIPDSGMPKQSQSSKIPPSAPTPPAPVVDDSPHSKFLKYTELAKQLSSK